MLFSCVEGSGALKHLYLPAIICPTSFQSTRPWPEGSWEQTYPDYKVCCQGKLHGRKDSYREALVMMGRRWPREVRERRQTEAD